MRHWKRKLLGMTLAAAGLVGCKQHLFDREAEIGYYRNQALKFGAPPNLDTDINSTIQPATTDLPPLPPTVDSPDRPPRPISLQEAISIALERGTVGFRTLDANAVGAANENPRIIFNTLRSGNQSDAIR